MGIQDPGHRLAADTNPTKTGRRRFGASTVVLAIVLVLSIVAALLLAFDPAI